MKNSRNFYRFIAFSLCILGATALFYKMCHSMCAIRYVTFAFDPQFSFNACEAIKKQVALAQSDEVYNPQTIVDEISYYFESVKSVTLQQLPHHTTGVRDGQERSSDRDTPGRFHPYKAAVHNQAETRMQRLLPCG